MSTDEIKNEEVINELSKQAAKEPSKPIAEGKVYAEDYVKALREESASHRVRAKQAESAIRDLLGISKEDELGDVASRVSEFKSNLEKSNKQLMQKSRDMLIKAEIKSLEGYDHKLVDRLIDRRKISVSEDGQVEGLKEVVEELEKEFPAVRSSGNQPQAVNPGSVDNMSPEIRLQEAKKKNDFASYFSILEAMKRK